MSLLGDLNDGNDYSKLITGYYVHRFDEDKENIEVTAINLQDKIAILGDGSKMNLKILLEGWTPVADLWSALPDGLPGAVSSGPTSSLLGDLSAQDAINTHADEQPVQQHVSQQNVISAMPAVSTDIFEAAPVFSVTTAEHTMISNAIKLSAGSNSTLTVNCTIDIDFDIEKVMTIANTLGISSEITTEVLLSSEYGPTIVNDILTKVFSK